MNNDSNVSKHVLVSAGWHNAVLKRFHIGKSITKKPYFDIEFTITDSSDYGRSAYTSIQDIKSYWIMERLFEAFAFVPGDKLETDGFIGKRLSVCVSNASDPNGDLRPTVSNIRQAAAQVASEISRAKK